MLKIEREKDGLFVIEVTGKIDAGEMEEGLDKFIGMTGEIEGGRLLYRITDFELPTIGAMVVELRKSPDLFSLIRRFQKAAVISDAAWIRSFAQWEGMLIPGFDIKSYLPHHEEEARSWLRGENGDSMPV